MAGKFGMLGDFGNQLQRGQKYMHGKHIKSLQERADWRKKGIISQVQAADTAEKQELISNILESTLGRKGFQRKSFGGKTLPGFGSESLKPIDYTSEMKSRDKEAIKMMATSEVGSKKYKRGSDTLQQTLGDFSKRVGPGPKALVQGVLAGTDQLDRVAQVTGGGALVYGGAKMLSALTQQIEAVLEYQKEGDETKQSRS